MIKTSKRNLHWAHYNILESDIDIISRYIEFTEDNFGTYSIQLAHFLLAVGSEIDVIFRELCSVININAKAKNIIEYKNVVIPKYGRIVEMEVSCSKYGLRLTPWNSWAGDGERNPDWWQAYNAV